MSHNEIRKWFELYFPSYAGDQTIAWFPNGKNSIRIRQSTGREFIFTYHSATNWKFETVDSRTAMKGEKTNGRYA